MVTSSFPQTENADPTLLKQTVAILDCGAQYTKVIDRKVRELSIRSEILPLDVPLEVVGQYGAIILSGGPNSVFDPNAPVFNPEILNLNLPILGICYGMQLIAHHSGGKVEPGTVKEYGETRITLDNTSPLFYGLAQQEIVLMSHGDWVSQLPPGFVRIADSEHIPAAVAHREKRIYGVQFHPEVELTVHGHEMLRNFLYIVCGLKGEFSLELRLDDILAELRSQVGDNNVFVLVSGGVDSAVTAALLLKALPPEQVYALHVDTGFMRYQESDTVCEALKALGLHHLEHLKAEAFFLNASTEIDGQFVGPLKTVTNPEEKRRIIGDVFFRLTQEAIEKLNLDLDKTYIAQGTLRPDLIESGNIGVSKIAHKIKTHHNVVPVIQRQREKGMIVEPNRDLHKDEVRKIGRLLGLPEDIVSRQPFPGPGLAIRVLCTEKPYMTEAFESLNAAVYREAQSMDLHGVILPVQSVGVQGDFRSYSYLAALSGSYPEDWEQLKGLATDIPNRHHGINRVVLVLNRSHQMPDTINWVTPTYLNHESLELIRLIDHEVISTFSQAGLLQGISQLLSVLVPVDTQNRGRHSVAIRAVVTSDYMTARPARLGDEIPWSLMQELDIRIRERFPIDCVMYDLTSKPPATVEWE